jgi:hypothetical protein
MQFIAEYGIQLAVGMPVKGWVYDKVNPSGIPHKNRPADFKKEYWIKAQHLNY